MADGRRAASRTSPPEGSLGITALGSRDSKKEGCSAAAQGHPSPAPAHPFAARLAPSRWVSKGGDGHPMWTGVKLHTVRLSTKKEFPESRHGGPLEGDDSRRL